MTAQTDFMATWRDLRGQCSTADGSQRRQVQQLMRSLLEQYGPDLKQCDLSECVADLRVVAEAEAAATSATVHHRSE